MWPLLHHHRVTRLLAGAAVCDALVVQRPEDQQVTAKCVKQIVGEAQHERQKRNTSDRNAALVEKRNVCFRCSGTQPRGAGGRGRRDGGGGGGGGGDDGDDLEHAGSKHWLTSLERVVCCNVRAATCKVEVI